MENGINCKGTTRNDILWQQKVIISKVSQDVVGRFQNRWLLVDPAEGPVHLQCAECLYDRSLAIVICVFMLRHQIQLVPQDEK